MSLSNLDDGDWVRVHFHFRKKLFSVSKKGKVIDHLPVVKLVHPVFKVGKKGQERVRRECRKNVHAYVYGFYSENVSYLKMKNRIHRAEMFFYNPYKNDGFIDTNGNIINKAKLAVLTNTHGCMAMEPEYE